jgi:branched-chain amino acid transport system ATP-binding protein
VTVADRVLDVDAVVAGYGSNVDVLREVSLNVGRGEAVALVGSNGAGKSTVLRVVSGLLSSRGGTITFCGSDIGRTAAHRIAQAGMAHVPEGRQLFVHQTVRENLMLGGLRNKQRDERMEALLEVFTALRPKLDQCAGELSGGQQQMVAIARGLMAAPTLLVLDEPSLGLSPKLVDEVAELLKRVLREFDMSLLLVEQNTTIAAEVADRAYVMQRGQIVLEERAADLLSNRDLLRAYLG